MYEDSVDYMLGGTLTLKNGLIDKYYFEDGYCKIEKLSDNSGESIRYYYYDQDHLGNIRQVTEVDENCIAKVVQINNYYPFGMQYCDGTVDDFDQNHKYNGKEYDKMHGLNTYDYGARQYNPVTARWDRMDPLCEKKYGVSPYVYCHDNPVNRIDPDGRYDWENICLWGNPVVAVFPYQRDDAITKDYEAAKNAKLPIIIVNDVADLSNALSDIFKLSTTYDCITLNSHGDFNGFNIGSEQIDIINDLSNLKSCLEGKTIFIGACDVGKNKVLVDQIAQDTGSLVIASEHKIPAGYSYDGSKNLNRKFNILESFNENNKFLISNGSTSQTITDVTIDKNLGINWNEKWYSGIFKF